MYCVLQIYPVDKVIAQHYSWEEFVEKISVDEYDDGEDMSPLLEELAGLHEHPFNLNTATKDDLEQLPFLDADEIEEILAYVYRYGPMQSLGDRGTGLPDPSVPCFVRLRGKSCGGKRKVTVENLVERRAA